MVRGLDYYTRTAFEVVAGDLGAQNAVCGGAGTTGWRKRSEALRSPRSGLPSGLSDWLCCCPRRRITCDTPTFSWPPWRGSAAERFRLGPGPAQCRGLGGNRLRRQEPEKPDAQGRPAEGSLRRHSRRRGIEEEQVVLRTWPPRRRKKCHWRKWSTGLKPQVAKREAQDTGRRAKKHP